MNTELQNNIFDASSEYSGLNNDILSANNPLENNSTLLNSEIIFIDETVTDYQSLITGFEGSVFTLDSNFDGIEQITEVLSQQQDISGVHLISHGNKGSLQLGATGLNSYNLDSYLDQLISWGNSLLDDADFLIYGCDVARGEVGENFVSNLSNLIGADIAASSDLTGNRDLGGDWDLEYTTGEIETESIADSDYQGTLATVSLVDGALTYTSADEGSVSTANYTNDLNLYVSGNELYIQDTNTLDNTGEGITAGDNVTQVDDNTVKVIFSEITAGLNINTADGGDSIIFDSSFNSLTGDLTIATGDGQDTVTIDGFTSNLDLSTGDNDDTVDISGLTGNLTLATNSGEDTVTIGDIAGSLDIHGGGDSDRVTVSGDVNTNGGDLSIDSENITVNDGVSLTTRQISGSDYVNDVSIGDSGDITLDGRVITLDGANLYSHVLDTDSYNPGNISITALEEAVSTVFGGFDTFDVDLTVDPFELDVDVDVDGVDDSTATIDLIGANLLGGDITLDAAAIYSEDDFVNLIDNYSLFVGAAIAEATATVNIDANSAIDASSLTAEATTNADAIMSSISLGFDAGLAYGLLEATAEVIVDGTVTVDNDLTLNTQTDNTLDVQAVLGGYTNVAGGVAISILKTNTTTQIGQTANINVGGNLSVTAETVDRNYTLANSTTGTDGTVGIAASVSVEEGATNALIDALNPLTVGGDVLIDANQYSEAVPQYLGFLSSSGTAAKAGVNTNSTGNLINDTQSAIASEALGKLKSLFSSKASSASDATEGNAATFDIGAAVAYAGDINDVTARIGNSAIVTASGGAIDIEATAANRPNVSANSTIAEPTSSDPELDNSKFAGSAGVAIGDYNNNAYAYIGDSAEVNAQQAISVESAALNDYSTTYGINLYDAVTGDGDFVTEFQEFTNTFTGYLNSNLGLDKYVFDSWSQATAAGSDTGIAGAVTILGLNHISEAFIEDNALINQDDTLRSDNQTVTVNAVNVNEAVHFGGNLKLPGITGDFATFSLPSTSFGGLGTDNDNSVGGTALIINYDNDTKAKIGDGVSLYADSLEVDADNTTMSISIAASGGEADTFGFNGTGTWLFVDNDTIAQIHSGATIEVGDNTVTDSDASLVVDARDESLVVNISGGVVISDNIGIGASVSLNTVDRNTQAFIGITDEETAPATKKTLIVDGDVDINAENTGYLGSFALASAIAKDSLVEQPESAADYESVSVADTAWGIAFSGEVGINTVIDTTKAYIGDINLESSDTVNIYPSISINANNDSDILTIGGSVAISAYDVDKAGSVGIAGSFQLNLVESETKAYLTNSVLHAGSLDITATNDTYILAIGASGSGSFNDTGIAIAGTAIVNDVTNNTYAYIDSSSEVNTSSDVTVTATDSSSIMSVSGALQLSGQYGVGASVGLNFTKNKTLAYIEDGDVTATNLSLSATNSSDIHAFAVAAGASLDGMAVEFSLTYNETNNITEAYIDNGDSQLETNLGGNLSLSATDDSEIFSLAGVFGLSLLAGSTDNYAATIGISVAINEIENETKARIKDGRVVVEGDLELIADSTSDIQAYSVAGSGAASWSSTGLVLSGAGAGTRNKVKNTIEASITDADTSNNIDTDVDVTGTVNLSATDNSTIIADAGGAAISLAIAGDSWATSAAISVGAGIANNEISNTVTAFISDAVVEADSNLSVSAISNATIDAFALGAAVSGTYSSSGIGISLAGAGAGTENKINNSISAYIANDSDVTTNNSGAIALLAQDNSKVTADAGGYAIALKFGNGITNGSASVGVSMADNDIENTVEAYISDAVVTSAAGIDVTATATGTIDLFSIGAAASGSVGSGGLNVALSGAGTGVENKIANTILAFISNDSTVESKNNGAISLIATDSSTVVADAGGFAVAVAIGSGFSGGVTAGVATAENIINNTVRAYIDDSKVTADGDLNLDATATSTIDNLTMAGAVSVAASESAALSASGAGTSTTNEVTNTIEAYIQNDSDIDSNSSISLNAEDNSTIESVAVGGSISISGSTEASFSLAIAAVEVENNISNTVRAYIGDIDNDSTTINAAGDLNLTANSTLTFEDNYAIAASFAASVAPASASFSGAGANVTTETTNTVEAVIRNLNSTDAVQADNVILTATDTPTIKPTVGSGALAASFVGASVSVSLTDTTINNSVNSYIDNSEIITTSDVTLTANSTPTVESEAVTTSVAAAIGGAGAGGEVSVTISSDVASYISGNAEIDAGDVTVEAIQTPTIIADVFGLAVSSVAAVGASVTDIEFKGTTKAYVKSSDVYTTGNLDITATSTPSLDAEVTAVSAGIVTSGAGNGVTVKDNSTTEAYASNSSYLDIDSTLNITATAQPELIGDALGVSAAGGVQVGYSEVTVTVAPEIDAYIGSNVEVNASDLNLTAQTILPDTGISAEANASASGGSLFDSINAANAKAINNASTTININSNAELNITNTATLQTDLNSSQDAYADGYNGGIRALGFNFAEANSDTTNKITFASGAEVNAGSLIVAVDGTEDNYAEAVAGGGGIISGRAAEATTDSVSDTQVVINSDIEVDTLDISAEHTATFNSKSDSVNASVVGGSGAYTENTVTADITVNFNSNAGVTATDDFDVTLENNIEQEELSDQNAEAASGGLLDGSAVETVTTINNSSVINVNDGAVLAVGDEDYDTIDNLDFSILNDVSATSKSKLANGGAISTAKAEAEVTNNTNEAIINIENADITSTHDIDFSVRSIVDLETEVKASAWGISGVSKGESLVETTVDNEINLNDGASVIAEQDANFYVGENSSGATNDIDLDAETDLWNKSASPMEKSDIDADSNLTLNNTIYIHDDAELATSENINLITNDDSSTYSVDAEGEGTDLYLQVVSTLASLFGGDVSSVITNDSTSVNFNNGIDVDGSLIAGQNNQQYLYITGSNGSYSYDMSDRIESEPTVTTEDITASIDDTIAALESERSQYENSDSDGDAALYLTLSAEIEFWENEKAKIGDGDISVINLPNISASVGNINIAGGYLTGEGNIEARGNAEINISNSTEAYLRVNDVNINDNYGGELFFNNVAITDSDQLESNDFNSIVTGSDLGEPEINILNDSDSILEVKGSLINRNGSISLKNVSGSIYVTEGEISAKSIDIESGESFFLSDGYLFSVDSSPEALWNDEVKEFIEAAEEELIYDDGDIAYGTTGSAGITDATSNDSTVSSKLSEAENPDGGISAESSIFIASEYINISGNLSSGVSEYDFTIDSGIESEFDASALSSQIYNGKYYLLTDENLNWNKAQEAAEALGGNLVTINDEAEQTWLHDTFGSDDYLWIGLNDKSTEGNFEWANGETVDYTNWDTEQPDDEHFDINYFNSTDGVAMNPDGTWDDFLNGSSSFKKQGIIELDADSEYLQELFNSDYDLTNYLSNASGNNISGYYSPLSDSIVIEDLEIQGGYIQLVGNILSTGNGNIEVMDGFGDISIDNNSSYDLELNTLDTGGEGTEGKIIIIDNGSGTPVTTTYTKDDEGIVKTVDGEEVTSDTDIYAPQETHPYNWYYQKEQTLTLTPLIGSASAFAQTAVSANESLIPSNYEIYGDSLYFVTNTKNSWLKSQEEAEFYGGNLVAINDAAENTWINDTFSSYGNLWIGYSDSTSSGIDSSEGNFIWMNGDTSTYTNWNSGEPNNSGNEDYAEIYADSGRWNDTESNDENQYGLVEIPLDELEFGVGSIDTTYETQDPEVYVYEPPDYSGVSGGFEAILAAFASYLDNIFNFTEAVDYPSYKGFIYNLSDLEVDEDNNLITIDVGSHYVNAVPHQYDIDINFFGSDTATIDVDSTNNIWLTDDITNQAGDVNLTSDSGSITASSEIEINANELTLDAGGSIGDSDIAINTNLDGGTLDATATGDVYINETTGDITVDEVTTSGNVNIDAYGNLEADSSGSKITGEEINLTSETGNIGSSSLDINIDSGSSDTGSVTLDAAGDISVTETSGDLYLVSADANDGDVSISVSNGDLIDHNPESTEDLAARAELLDATWSEMELTDEDISTTDTDETGAASALAAEAVTAYEQSKETEYELYWQYRNLTQVTDDDGTVSYTFDDYDAEYVYSFGETETAQLEELGYSDSAISELEDNKTEQYHSLHEELATSGLTDDYDPDYTYTATTEESAEISEGAIWTVDELTRVINPSLLLPISDTEINIEADNVRAANLTLDVDGGIGINEGNITITVRDDEGNILGISDENLLYLLSAESRDITYLDDSGNEVADFTNNIDSIYTIAIAQIEDLDFEATGELNVTATADTYLGSEGDITINDLDVGNNEIRLKSGNGITGTDNSTHITADNIVIEAGDSSIGSSTNPIEIETNTITARGNNDIYINQASGDLEIEQIYSGDNVDITVVGKVSDASDTDDENIRSTDIAIDSSNNNSLGSSDNYLDVYVESGGTYEIDTSQDAYILNTYGTGIINIDVTGTTGTLSYSGNTYTITDSSSGTSVNFIGFDIINLNFASQDNSFTVASLAAETTLNIVGDSGNDSIELSNSLEGTVTLDGGTGTNTLVLDDSDDTAANSYQITETEITGLLTETISYSNIDNIDIESGSNSNDVLTVINETDTARTITADNSLIVDSSFPDISHSDIEAIDYYAESGSNDLDLTSFTDTDISLTVYSNLGDNENTLDLDAPGNHASIVVAVDENATILKVADINHASNSFSLSGTDAAQFEIVNSNELHFIATPDFETQSSYELTVTANGTDEINLTISITDINETPTLTLDKSNLIIAEDTDTTNGVKIGDITITDDALGEETLSLSGDDAELFEIVNDTELYLVGGTELDYETNPDLDVTVTADDGTFSVDLDITVDVTDINEIASVDFDFVNVADNEVLVLDGDGDYVETNSDVANLTSADFTIEAWIQTSEVNQGILGKDDGDSSWENGEKAFYVNGSGKVEFIGRNNGKINSNSTVNDGKWHHVMVVWDATNEQGSMYIDGIEDTATDSYNPNKEDNDGDTLKLGLAYADDYFAGKLDKIIVWNKALTYEEIQSNLASGVAENEENIVAFYDFEDENFNYYNTLIENAYLESDRTILTLAENTDTTERVKIADINISDDALGTNELTLSGDDEGLFELDGTELYLSDGVTLDYETNPILDVDIEVEDETVGSTPDDTVNLRIVVSDTNDAPVITAEFAEDSIPEDTDTTERIKIADISITDADSISTEYTVSLVGNDEELFELDGTELYLVEGATLDYETNPNLEVSIRVDDPSLGDTFDSSLGIIIPITNTNEIFELDYSDTNQALSLDGDDDYADTNAEIIDLTNGNFTLEAWIKTTDGEQGIITKNDGDTDWENRERAFYLDDEGKVVFAGNYNGSITGTSAVNDGEWHHVVAVWNYDTGDGYIYVDGVDDTDSDTYRTRRNDGNGHTIRIGSPRNNNNYFTGEIDEIRIWDKALTASEIADNFNRTTNFVAAAEDNLVAYYTFQTGLINDDTVTDESQNNYNLTLVNEPKLAIATDLNINNSNGAIILPENSADGASVKIADITITDNSYTTSNLTLTGDDAELFTINGTELLLNAGTPLDFESDTELKVTIALDSETIEAAEEIIVRAIDTLELINTVTELDENTDTSERIQVAELDISETTLSSNTITLTGDDAEYFEIEDFVLYLKADTTLNFETQDTYNVTVAVDDLVGSTVDTSIDFTLTINDLNEAPTAISLNNNSTNFTNNLFLNGSEVYLDTNAPITNFYEDITLEAWIQTTRGEQAIISKSNGDSRLDFGELSFYISDTGELAYKYRFGGSSVRSRTGSTPVNDGQLHHVALVWDRNPADGNLFIYVDGKLDLSLYTIQTVPYNNSSTTVKVGAPFSSSQTDDYFDGFLDEVRIWNIARTQSEIIADMGTTLTGTETGLAAYYNDFNSDYTNTTITDVTGNYDGTLVNSDLSVGKISLPENIDTSEPIKLTEFSIVDEDFTNTSQVAITGEDSGNFELVAIGERSYELYLAAGVTIDYETTQEMTVQIEVTDSELDDEAIIVQSFTVAIANENEAPSLTVETIVTELDENTPIDERVKVAEAVISDEDENDAVNRLVVSGNDAEYLELDGNSLYLKAGTTLDYETKSQMDFTLGVNGAIFGSEVSDSVDMSIAINDVNDAPSFSMTPDSNLLTDVLALDGGNYSDRDYIEIDSDLLDLSGTYTFETWFKTTTKNRGIFVKDGEDNSVDESGEQSLIIDSSGRLTYLLVGGSYDRYYTFEVDTVVTDGEWHHVSLVVDVDNSYRAIYLDGNLGGELSGRIDTTNNPEETVRVGAWGTALAFDGEMRDTRFWNTARSQTEIQANLNAELTGTETGLTVLYDFSNITETQAIDKTANGIHGTLIGDAGKTEVILLSEDIDTTNRVKIADLTVSDEDTASDFLNNTLSFSETDSEIFEIDGMEVYLKKDAILDYDTQARYDLTVQLDDGTYSEALTIEIGITPVNEPLSLTLETIETSLTEDTDTSGRIKVANLFIDDDSEAQDFTLTGDDADKFQLIDATDDFYNFELEADYDSDTPNFAIDNVDIPFTTDTTNAIKIADLTINDGAGITGFTISGDNEDSFVILNSNELYLQAGVTIDSETSFDITVEATDGTEIETASVNVSLSELEAEVKELYLKANATLDYESDTQFDVTIEATDGEYSDSVSYSLAITDIDEVPVFALENIVESLEENTDTTVGYKVADLAISDDDANDNTITITGDDEDKFVIINDSELYLVDGTVLDYETQRNYNITVTVSDINHTTDVDYSLEVINQIENPVTITYENAIADGDTSSSVDGIIAESRDTSERIKIADVVITGGEGNETFTIGGYNGDDYEVEGNTIYLKAGTDLSKYGDGEAFGTFTVNVDGSDSSEDFRIQIISPELLMFSVYYEYDEDDDEYYQEFDLINTGESFNFSNSVDVASGSTTDELDFYNWGYDTLDIESVTITGEHSSDFNITTDLSFPLSLGFDLNKTFTVEFNPSSGGELTAALEIISNDAEENPYIVYLNGTGVGSEINVTQEETDYNNGDSQDFGIVEIDTEIAQQTFTINNSGTETLSISDIAISGTNADEFTTDFSVSEIAAGESAEMTVNFTPTTGGDRSAILTINNNDDDESAFSINLTGNGAIAEIDLVQGDTELLSGTTQDFGSVNIDNGEIQQTFTIQNNGTKTLNIGDIEVTGTNASYFILENSSAIANTQIEAGDSVDLTITFNPRTAETATATLTIDSDDSDESAYTINLTGTGTESTNVSGSDNDDNIDNDDENRNVDAGGGDDTVTGNDNSENLRGGDGNDQVYGEDGNDRAYGDNGDDVIVGGAGRDFLRGGADNDLIFGGADADYLIGDAGDDYLDGEEDSDRLRGGAGSDTFVLTSGNGTDLILDFKVNEDHFELTDLSVSDLTFEDSGSFGLIKFGDEILARVRNVTAQDLTNYFSSNL